MMALKPKETPVEPAASINGAAPATEGDTSENKSEAVVTAAPTGPCIRLDLGCGSKRLKGWIGYDLVGPDTKKVDVVWDLEKTPWKGKEGTHVSLTPWDGLVWMWPDSSVEEARFHRSLEYMGQTPAALRAIFAELWRVLRPGGLVHITYLDPRSEAWMDDPDAARAVTPGLIRNLGGFEVLKDDHDFGAEPQIRAMSLRAVKEVPEEE